MRIIFIVMVCLLAACSKKEDLPVAGRGILTTSDTRGWPVIVQEHTTESGIRCVVATYTQYNTSISCDWK